MKILPDDDRGETLVESLTSIMFIGVAVMGILTALGMAMFQSSLYERKSDALAELRNRAEGLTYVTCASPADYESAGLVVESVHFLVPGVTPTYTATVPASCPSTDSGTQQLTLKLDKAAAESGKAPATATLTVVVRRP